MRSVNKQYIDRYFEGTLSEEEEQDLKDFLATPEGQASEYDEIRAVMGFFAAGKAAAGKDKTAYSKAKTSSRLILARVMAVAASLAILFALGVNIYNAKRNVCVSYVNGVEVKDKEAVMNDVDGTLSELLSNGPDVDAQLNEMFNR